MKKNTWYFDFFWLTAAILIFFCFMLGCRALSVPDEARYTEIPREMLFLHDFITPHLDGVKYFEKPPLLYWIQAGMIALFGINEWALRLPTAILAMFGCLSVYSAGRFLFNRSAGILAALLLASSPLYFAMAHSITLDMTVSVWLTITLLSFIAAIDLPIGSAARRNLCWLMFVAAAFAVLTKGLIGILFPGMICFTWLLIFNRWKDLLHLHLISGLIIFLLITLPWHILVQLKNPEFFQFYFIEQHFTRYLTKAMGRYQPVWWFVPILIIGIFPWIVFLCQAIAASVKTTWQNRSQKHREIFLLIWAAEIFIFFSLSHSKLIPYIVPVLPPLAILLAKYLQASEVHKIAYRVLAALAFVIAAAALVAPYLHHGFSSQAINALRLMAIPLLLMGLGVLFIGSARQKLYWLFFTQVLLLWSFVAVVPYFDLRPVKTLALKINQLAKPNDIVASYGLYYQDLPVYTQRLVLIVNWRNELSFGYAHQASAKERMIDAEQFWQLWQKPQRMFAVIDQEDYQRFSKQYPMHVLATHDDDLLISNQ